MNITTRSLALCTLLSLTLIALLAGALESTGEEPVANALMVSARGEAPAAPSVIAQQPAGKAVTAFRGRLKKFAFKSADDEIVFSAEPLGPVPNMNIRVRSRGRSAFILTFCTTPFDWVVEEVFTVRARIDGVDMAPGWISWATDIQSAGDDAFAARSFVSCAQWGMDKIAAGLHTVEVHAGITPGTVKMRKRTLFVQWTK